MQIGAKMKKLWPFENNCTKLEGHFEMISKFNLWIRNPLRNDTNFEFIHCHFDVPPPLPRELHLFNLWIRNLFRNDTNFEFTHYYFDVSPPLPRELHLGHFIHPKWTPHDYKSPFYYFLIIFRKLFCNKWSMRVPHVR